MSDRGGGAERTVILVHGAWHGAWCWEPVVAGLRERGVLTIAVDLPSRSGTGSLASDAAFVRAVIEGIEGPVDVEVVPGSTDLEHALVVGTDGVIRVDPDVAVAALFADVTADQAAAAIALLTPQPAATLGESVSAVAWHDIPSTYVVCTSDRAIPVVVQRALATRATKVIEWPTSHSPFLSQPLLVVEMLAELAGTGRNVA